MEKLAELNYSLLNQLPAEVQSFFKSFPLSDYSLLLIVAAVVIICVFMCACPCSKKPEYVIPEEFKPENVGKKEKEVKVKIPNTKKTRRGNKKKSKENEAEPVNLIEETKKEAQEEEEDDGWEKVKAKKPKKKEE
ncbi:hypothetical protein SteCoe_18177 [Stentor coeruleus]|uniref:Uncharacterized protein n=1 Tax=Stentor coeruleus TaxID=5963 RepID=A0A1R2BX85_9CILI|nr:hypothetical protein SteCoe_18177 [Stentor coeruleus]